MRRSLGKIALLLLVCVAGVVCAELLARVPACRGAIAKIFGRGELMAVVEGTGIYEAETSAATEDDSRSAVIAQNLARAASAEVVSDDAIEREVTLLRFQFPDEKAFVRVLNASGLPLVALREQVAEHLRARQWIEKQIASQLTTGDQEQRQFYEAHREQFLQPQRFRAAHVFLSAHEQTPPEQVEAKRRVSDVLSRRLAKEKNLPQVAAEVSEDEATKPRGGDLGVFAESRMLPEFIAEVAKLRAGQISAAFQTPIGFHIVQLTGSWSPRQLTFEEARPEIVTALANQRRTDAVEALAGRLSTADYVRTAR